MGCRAEMGSDGFKDGVRKTLETELEVSITGQVSDFPYKRRLAAAVLITGTRKQRYVGISH